MSKYTRGPWDFDWGDKYHSKYRFILGADKYGDREFVCEIFGGTEEEIIANANLIVTAPELLHALKYVRRYLNEEDHDVGFVDAIIAKADGNPKRII